MPIKLSISGIRGQFQELSPDQISRYVQAFVHYSGRGDFLLGYDGRPSSSFIRHATISALRSAGANVYDCGNTPTPILQWIIRNHTFRGGISITGGHNTFDWNSLIFLTETGAYLNHLEGEEYFNLYHSGKKFFQPYNRLGKYQWSRDHLVGYMKALQPKSNQGKGKKFVIDCSYGFEKNLVDLLADTLGIRLIPIFYAPSDRFYKDPEPNPGNAAILATIVGETGADGGFLLNSDGSRLLIVDERGTPMSEEFTLPLFASIILKEEKTDLVTNYSTSMVVDSVARRNGVKVYRTDVGQPYVVQMVHEIGARVGGEGSGSVVYAPFSSGFDSFLAIRMITGYLEQAGLTLSNLVEDIPEPQTLKETIFLAPHRIYNLLERVGNMYPDVKKLKDGFYIGNPSQWLCIRASATVSMIRIVGEGPGIAEEISRIKELIS